MVDIWQQFHSLPKAIRDGVATPSAIATVDDLEQRYPGVDLANLIMRVVVHEFPVGELSAKLQAECSLDRPAAEEVSRRLRQEVFVGDIADYLGLARGEEAGLKPASQPPSAPPAGRQPVSPAPRSAPPVNLPVAESAPSRPPAPPGPPPKTAPAVATIRPPTAPWLTPATPVGSQAPITQYSDDDAAEIERQAAKLRTLTTVNPNQDFDSLARTILTAQNLAFADELLSRRAVSIIKARLKNIRQTGATADLLTRDPKVGGLGLDPDIAAQVAAAAERSAGELKSRGMVQTPATPQPPRPPVVPSVVQAPPPPLPPLRRDAPLAAPVIPPNVTEPPRPSRPIIRPADIPSPATTPTTIPRPAPPPARPAATVMTGARLTDRPTVADVVRPTLALGPGEEMRSLTLLEFRRLGQGATEVARKLLDKFQHFQRESFTVWVEAVAGWRQSDVFQLYVSMGRDSLELGQPISQIIADRGRRGQPYLSEHEFTVVADLNRQLQV
ncbi:MAG: hypothetical protein AAB619_01375, partial [Patescibacteria group bacterium]